MIVLMNGVSLKSIDFINTDLRGPRRSWWQRSRMRWRRWRQWRWPWCWGRAGLRPRRHGLPRQWDWPQPCHLQSENENNVSICKILYQFFFNEWLATFFRELDVLVWCQRFLGLRVEEFPVGQGGRGGHDAGGQQVGGAHAEGDVRGHRGTLKKKSSCERKSMASINFSICLPAIVENPLVMTTWISDLVSLDR